jgi:YafQ family addiction module toxin component
MAYRQDYTKPFLADVKKIRKNAALFSRLKNKIDEITENPEHYKPLKKKLKGKRRAHVGSYVLIFEVREDTVIFHTLKHHDYAYRTR